MKKMLSLLFILFVSLQANASGMRLIKLSDSCGWPAEAWSMKFNVSNVGNSKTAFTQSGNTIAASIPAETTQVFPVLWSAGNAEEVCKAHKTSKNVYTTYAECVNRAQDLDAFGGYFYWHTITPDTDTIKVICNNNKFPF